MSMYAEERQQAIAQLVTARGRLSVNALAEEYDVTTETVRRDLTALERLGLVHRVHGGAVPAGALASIEAGLVERESANTEAKDRIARAAVDLLPAAGGTVLFDAGSTTVRIAAALPRDHRLVAVTHSVSVASRLMTFPQVELHLLPGRVRATTQAAVGPDTIAALHDLRADLLFLGTNGLTAGYGLTTPDRDEAATKRALVAASRRVVLVADSSKIGPELAVRFANLGDIDTLVTDDAISDEDLRDLRAAGLEVVVA
ncbi:DeoR/GlpR family DNA-binding transcription regulator [Nocardioides sp.]|uniref:DeoR/GlpR family DNA-binding transcription regulator n=1 Tax=Nocardioides sp. TaxID=35761 RepID=UPI00286B5C84|nr:DeoR/GlpR family DNA-binding transcription regulator [Nocardioides sp.]